MRRPKQSAPPAPNSTLVPDAAPVYWSIPQLQEHVRRRTGEAPSLRQLQYDFLDGLLPASLLWSPVHGRVLPLYQPQQVRRIAKSRGWLYLRDATPIAPPTPRPKRPKGATP